jgi:hypothetical protein
LEYFTDIWSILRTFGAFYGHSGYFMTIWDILLPFGTFCVHFVFIWYIFTVLEKSGNTVHLSKSLLSVMRDPCFPLDSALSE